MSRLDDSYDHCLNVARSHYENFPVASVLLPRHMRKHVAAVYAFARFADDVADEITPAPLQRDPVNSPPAPLLFGEGSRVITTEERLSMLAHLDAIVDGAPHGDDPIFIAVQNTIEEKKLDRECFHRLLEAFRRDVNFVAMKNWPDVLEYCSYSANPVGEIILQLSGDATDESVAYSNDICTALQITNFLQDRQLDMQRGRNYLPLPKSETIQRTRALFERGSLITQKLENSRMVRNSRLRWELKTIIAGGRTMLELCERTNIEVERPKLGWRSVPLLLKYLLR